MYVLGPPGTYPGFSVHYIRSDTRHLNVPRGEGGGGGRAFWGLKYVPKGGEGVTQYAAISNVVRACQACGRRSNAR